MKLKILGDPVSLMVIKALHVHHSDVVGRAHSGTGPVILRFQDWWWKKLTSDLTYFSDT